jgi:Zn-dependent peptidase ImmA (M78 family)/transcriptional regulator with XRE-family HTH domain
VAERIEALVKAELLVWARRTAKLGIEAAAEAADISQKKIEAWEAGEGRPSIPQLRKLASAYKRPLAAFYLPEPPAEFDVMRDFRRLPEASESSLANAQLQHEIRVASWRRELAIEIARELDEQFPKFSLHASLEEDPVEVARRARVALGVTDSQQFKWVDPFEALTAWREAVERLGVLVFQTQGIPIDEMRGFSVSAEEVPVVALNGKDSPRGRVFTLLHELIHLMLGAGGVCNLDEGHAANRDAKRVEVFCNRVAGAVLVPPELLLGEAVVLGHSTGKDWEESEIAFLADRYSVSRETLIRSLVLTGKATERFYALKRAEYLHGYSQHATKKKSYPVPVYRKVISRNGRRFSRLVVDAYREETITGSDLANYLGVRLKHLGEIENALSRSSAKAR